jgi:hypothetical protein
LVFLWGWTLGASGEASASLELFRPVPLASEADEAIPAPDDEEVTDPIQEHINIDKLFADL